MLSALPEKNWELEERGWYCWEYRLAGRGKIGRKSAADHLNEYPMMGSGSGIDLNQPEISVKPGFQRQQKQKIRTDLMAKGRAPGRVARILIDYSVKCVFGKVERIVSVARSWPVIVINHRVCRIASCVWIAQKVKRPHRIILPSDESRVLELLIMTSLRVTLTSECDLSRRLLIGWPVNCPSCCWALSWLVLFNNLWMSAFLPRSSLASLSRAFHFLYLYGTGWSLCFSKDKSHLGAKLLFTTFAMF